MFEGFFERPFREGPLSLRDSLRDLSVRDL